MRAWTATGPVGTRWEAVRLRLVSYHPSHHPDGEHRRRLVVQSLGHDGKPVAEDPIYAAMLEPQEIVAYLEASLDEGWRLEPERYISATRKDPPPQRRKPV